MPASQIAPVQAPISVTANSPAARITLPASDTSQLRVLLTVHESAGVVELVSDPAQTKGLTIPTQAAGDENFQAGSYNVHAELYLYAAAPVAVTLVPVVLPNQ